MNRVTVRLLTMAVGVLLPVSAFGEVKLDRYGGYKGLKGHNRSGFFRVEKMGDRFYLITPDNNAFLSTAVTTAIFNDRWGGHCPPIESYPTPFGNKARYNNDRDAWRASLKGNLSRFGFNSLGCWCEQGVPGITENVQCLHIDGMALKKGVAKVGRNFPDVFDPRFAEAAETRAKSLAKEKDHPFRIGAFPDNEISWPGPDYWGKGGPTFPDAFIALGANVPAKQFWAGTLLKDKYKTIERLNTAYGTSFTDFIGNGDTLINVTELPNHPDHPAIFEDKKDFVEAIADRYYSVTTSLMRQYDPHHLVFSARWALWTTAFHKNWPEHQAYNERIWKKAGEYCDVIAINSYMDNGALERDHKLYSRWFAASGKPFMITEWATFADDTQFAKHPEWRRYQKHRGEFYFNQVKTLMDFAFAGPDGKLVHPCVGAQWFQYYDEPSLGRTDGERTNFGLLTVQDEPYQTALDVMRTLNVQLYDYVIEDKPLRLLDAPQPKLPLNTVPTTQAVDVPKVSRQSAQPAFEWSAVDGADTYTLLISPAKSFPERQTIRIDDLRTTHHTPERPLAAGLWYWCVAVTDKAGLSGKYSDPAAFYVEDACTDASPKAYLDFEDLSGWRNVSLEDGGWDGVAWAFSDMRKRKSGKVSARVQFTMHSLNKQTGQQREREGEIVWRYVGPAVPVNGAGRVSVNLITDRATDVKGNMTAASKYVSLRIKDGSGQVTLDTRLDAEGKLAPMKWRALRFPLEKSLDGKIKSIEFYVDMTIEDIPWDQRLNLWVDNIRFGGR